MWVVYVSLSWLPEENLSSFVTIILWQKAWKEQVIQSFHMSFLCRAQVPNDLHAAAISRSRLCYNWIKGEKAYRTGWTPGSSCNWIKVPSPSPTLLGRTADQKVCRPTKAHRNPRSWGHKVTEIKKSVTFRFYFTQRKRLLKIFRHCFPSESSQPIYINEAAPVKEPARKRRKLSAQKIWAKIRVALARGGEI